MAVRLRKPILVGGVGVSFGLWLWWNLQESLFEVGEFGVLAAMAVGSGFWLLKRKPSLAGLSVQDCAPVTRERLEEAIAQVEARLERLQNEAPEGDLSAFTEALALLPERLHRGKLQVAIAGTKNAGKTSLKALLAGSEIRIPGGEIIWMDAEALLMGNEAQKAAKEVALASDITIFVVAGDLTESEFQVLQQLRAVNQRVLLVFNQQDRYLPQERIEILQQLRAAVSGIVASEDIIATAAAPSPLKVRQHQEDGGVQEWMETREPDIQTMRDRLVSILSREREQLVLATTWREAVQLRGQVQEGLNQVRRDRALPVIEGYQWIAAAATLANPVPALDLLATAAISAQLLVDLSEIYQQKFSLSQAQTASGTLGQLMVKLGIVELSTQAIGTILKGNAATYVAGGVLQGVSAAYLTRLAGLSLIEYFQQQDANAASGRELQSDRFGETLQKVFQQNQRTAFLQSFVKGAIARLSPGFQWKDARRYADPCGSAS
jgi:GTPase SAR1 family protein